MVETAKRSRDEFQAFYTHCNNITGYMAGLLNCEDGMRVLEPCAGDGAFIDELLMSGKNLDIHAFEMNPDSALSLENKYSDKNFIFIELADFVFLEKNTLFDRVIANPPYGAYQSPEKRSKLKQAYPNIYAKETYGLFLIKAMQMLKVGGRLVFIIPDTFLTLHMHEGLRKKLVDDFTIESLTLFPSKFFPGVNFGYAGLSIISVVKAKPNTDTSFPVYTGLKNPEELKYLLTDEKARYESFRLSYSQIKENPSQSFYLPSDDWVQTILNKANLTIGDLCDVVTGFYSGNDAKYLKRGHIVSRGSKKYATVETEMISDNNNPPLTGIPTANHWVPIVKGGNTRFYKPSEWFMDWSVAAINDYRVVNKKKARFQNSQYYFQQGIGVPMVSSSSITGALIDRRLFDQSIVGIFPKDESILMYLLGFFNSKVCNKLIRTINASTNNSSNYIKKLPIIIPDLESLENITDMVVGLYQKAKVDQISDIDLSDLDKAYDEVFGL